MGAENEEITEQFVAERAAKRAALGAAYLDEQEPGWSARVSLRRLNQQSLCYCVLGQLDGSYLDSPTRLIHGTQWRVEHGFDRLELQSGSIGSAFEFELLTNAWEKEIKQRRGENG